MVPTEFFNQNFPYVVSAGTVWGLFERFSTIYHVFEDNKLRQLLLSSNVNMDRIFIMHDKEGTGEIRE